VEDRPLAAPAPVPSPDAADAARSAAAPPPAPERDAIASRVGYAEDGVGAAHRRGPHGLVRPDASAARGRSSWS